MQTLKQSIFTLTAKSPKTANIVEASLHVARYEAT